MKPRKDPNFSASADMRLVELQRTSLGVQSPPRVWESNSGAEGGVTPGEPAPDLSGAVLICEITASPPAGVIPGAIVTFGLSLVNEGVKPARNVRITVPLPGGASYRNGSFVRDGRPQLDDAADELFATGTAVGEIAPKARITFLWKIGVRMGNKALVIAPSVTADETAVIGAEPAIVSRKEQTQTTFAAEVGRAAPVVAEPAAPEQPESVRPFYELDEEETLEHEAAEAALSPVSEYRPAIEPPVAPEIPPEQPEPIPAPAQPETVPEPGVPSVEPGMPPPPDQPPDIEPAAREAIALVGQIDRPSIAYFERIFNGSKPPTLLNHFILGGALACTRGPDGDFANLKTHLDAQGQLLQRIVLHERLGKKEPIAEYAGTMLAAVDKLTVRPVTAQAPSADKNVVLLYNEIDAPTLAVLAKMQDESARWDFTKARQLTLALQARSVIANAPQPEIERSDAALQAYAQTAFMQLQRFFVRMRLDRTTGLLYLNDEQLDAAARALIAALAALF